MQPFGQHINENLVGAIAHLYDKAIGAVHSPVVQSIVSLTNTLVKYSLSLRPDFTSQLELSLTSSCFILS